MELKEPEYIVDEHNNKKAVILDIKTYEKMVEIIEDKLLGAILQEEDEKISFEEAKEIYKKLKSER